MKAVEKEEAKKYKVAEKEENLRKRSGQPASMKQKKPTGHQKLELLAENSDSNSHSDSSSREQDSSSSSEPSFSHPKCQCQLPACFQGDSSDDDDDAVMWHYLPC